MSLCSAILLCLSCQGISQMLGLAVSRHAGFAVTGPFDNPGPFGGFVSVLLSVSASWTVMVWKETWAGGWNTGSTWTQWANKGVAVLSAAASVLGTMVLAASWSRTAWAGLAISIIIFLLKEKPLSGYGLTGGRSLKRTAALGAAVILIAAAAFFMKMDSAIGRLHIWHMEARVIAGHPLRGVGKDFYLGAYGEAQAEYFRQKDRPAIIKRVAGCPEYAFNEYLKFGMMYGLGGLMLSIAIAVGTVSVLLRRRSPFAYGAVVYAVFAFGSYPLSEWRFRLLGLAILAAAFLSLLRGHRHLYLAAAIIVILLSPAVIIRTVRDEKERSESENRISYPGQLSSLGYYEEALEEYAELEEEIEGNYRVMFDYGYALFKVGRYQEAAEVLSRGAGMSADPMFHVIAGRCHEASGHIGEAETEYIRAHWMVPCRLYPLVLLMEMYGKEDRMQDAERVRTEILSMPVNPRHLAMQELRGRAEKFIVE